MAALSYHNNMGGIVESSAKLFALGGDQAGGTGYVCCNFCYWYFCYWYWYCYLLLMLLVFIGTYCWKFGEGTRHGQRRRREIMQVWPDNCRRKPRESPRQVNQGFSRCNSHNNNSNNNNIFVTIIREILPLLPTVKTVIKTASNKNREVNQGVYLRQKLWYALL